MSVDDVGATNKPPQSHERNGRRQHLSGSQVGADLDGAKRRREAEALLGRPRAEHDDLNAALRQIPSDRREMATDTTFVVSPDLAADVENSRRALVAAASAATVRAADDVRRALDVPDKAAVVLAIGRLHRQKGFDVLVRAAALWPGRRVVVVIAGDGPQRDALSALITQLRVDVRLIGDRTDIADLLRVAEVVAMPSRWEGWPLTAGEVLAAGRPLVATAVGGLPELVGDAAILVPPDDDAALATAIARLLDDAEVAAEYRLRAANRAAELPTDDDVAEQLLACYTALASAP